MPIPQRSSGRKSNRPTTSSSGNCEHALPYLWEQRGQHGIVTHIAYIVTHIA
jgi:hypothetical protein